MEKSYNKLNDLEKRVIIHKSTEIPYSGKYNDFFEMGIYLCRQCNAPLYKSSNKFNSHCGWPAFEDEIKNAVKRNPDADGFRTEIVCAKCNGHLGHVFEGEGFTNTNIRHCVNSVSLNFIAYNQGCYERAVLAGGCFWGVEYLISKKEGVLSATSGYTGGKKENPTYEDVCYHNTGHAEAVEVIYDNRKVTYEELLKFFFEIHDPTQLNRQGPDIGTQYRSEIYYANEFQKNKAEELIQILRQKGYAVCTKLSPESRFWKAENYHQNYYNRNGSEPYLGLVKKLRNSLCYNNEYKKTQYLGIIDLITSLYSIFLLKQSAKQVLKNM
jgi:peptide methionine sulfoxide reductase msrA/msrB